MSDPSPDKPPRLLLRRYQAAALLLLGVLFGSASLFSRDSDLFPTAPRFPLRLALTFDDGPHPAFTDRLLRVLRQERVAATFFVVGKQAELYPRLLQDMSRQGHELANHTQHHLNLTTLTPDRVKQELDDTRALIEWASGKPNRFFRPPGGRYNEATLDAASGAGYRMVMWTVFPRDHGGPTSQEIHARVMADARDGGVVLMHSGVEATLEALPRIIHDLRAKGFHFLTISELLEERIDPRVLSAWYLPRKPAAPADYETGA